MGDSRIDSRIRELQEALLGAHAQVAGAVEELSETEAHQVPAPGEWTIAQLLAHIAEIQAFWTAKAILITQEDDPNITRTAVENDIREAAVTGQAHDSMADLLPRCQEANQRAIQLIGGIDPAYLERPGHRGEDNPITVQGVIRYLIGHVEEHVRQIAESRRLIREK
ncbi:MAG: DinB family protein [Chloroflexi bacterium]|nr:DinB family protein [Chloroflexota bacterium]